MGTKKAAPKQEFATKKELQELSNNVSALVDLIRSGALPAIVPTPEKVDAVLRGPLFTAPEPEIKQASPNTYQTNMDWEQMAREIIGKPVDHTELTYLKGGGLLFTVVIKEEFSNARAEYLERHGVDRRSKEIGAEGEAGVKVWCEQINANLNRLRPRNSE